MNKKFVEKLFRANVLRQGPGGLVRTRGLGPVSRRAFSGGLLTGAAATALLPGRTARADTAVNFMGWQGYEEGFAAGGFLEANGYSLNNTYMNDNNQIIATATAGGMGNMDIATPDHGYTPVMAEIGILQELDLERLPNYGNLFEFFKTMPGPSVDGAQYALPYTWGSIPLMYNPEFVKEKPTSWRDIMKPEYKGRVALTNDVISVIIPFTMTAAGTKTPTRITKDELRAAIDMIIEIKTDYARTIASGYGELADLFASGEVIMAQAWEPVAAWAGDKGVKLEWTVPQEGTWTLVDCLALITDSPNEDAAYDLLNHGLSAEAQAHVANVNTTGVTVEPAVPLLNERAKSMYPYDDIPQFFADTGGGPFPLWPLDPDGDYVTFDEVLDEWERFLKA
jgi:spermidine/putrescine-binding protein